MCVYAEHISRDLEACSERCHIYVFHCESGKDRTGLLSSALQMYRNFSYQRADAYTNFVTWPKDPHLGYFLRDPAGVVLAQWVRAFRRFSVVS